MYLSVAGEFNWSFDLEVKDASCIPPFVSEKEVYPGLDLSIKLNSTGEWAKIVQSIVKCTDAFNHNGNRHDNLFIIAGDGEVQ